MKQSLLFTIVALLLITSAYAQPVIHATDLNPQAGDNFIRTAASTSGVNIPGKGANVTWNYSKLQATGSLDTQRYVKSSTTPFSNSFPKSNVAVNPTTTEIVYDYYKTTNKDLEFDGEASNSNSVTFTPPYRLVTYPFTYGTKFNDSSKLTEKEGGTTIKEIYMDTVNAFGYGTLKLPIGQTFKNVILEKTTRKTSYTASGSTSVTESYSYIFFVAGYHDPLLTISVNNMNMITSVAYATNAKSTSDENELMLENKIIPIRVRSIDIYPNPARSSFTINMSKLNDKTVAAISVYDMSGRNVFRKQASMSSSETISCAAYKAGVYTVKIEMTDGSSQEQKVIVQN